MHGGAAVAAPGDVARLVAEARGAEREALVFLVERGARRQFVALPRGRV